MLAYRHAFHAGNHADVLKHLVLVQVLRHVAGKDKPFTFIDTHAGAGGYSLAGRHARKNAEHASGIGRLWGRRDLPPPLAEYVALVKQFNDGDNKLHRYPGSPGFAQMLLRPADRLRLYELHSTDQRLLAERFSRRPDTQVASGDGFAMLKAELPPPSRRGVVLIDPSYEIESDYPKVVATLREALTRFAEGTFIVWYPQLQTLASAQLPQRLRAAADTHGRRGWLHARLTVRQADERGFGLVGSGVFVVNPPFTLHESLRASLPFLVAALGQFAGANYLLDAPKA